MSFLNSQSFNSYPTYIPPTVNSNDQLMRDLHEIKMTRDDVRMIDNQMNDTINDFMRRANRMQQMPQQSMRMSGSVQRTGGMNIVQNSRMFRP